MSARCLVRLAVACGLALSLVGCVYAPYPPSYASAYPPGYGVTPPAYYYPAYPPIVGSIDLGFGFGGGWHDHDGWRGGGHHWR